MCVCVCVLFVVCKSKPKNRSPNTPYRIQAHVSVMNYVPVFISPTEFSIAKSGYCAKRGCL